MRWGTGAAACFCLGGVMLFSVAQAQEQIERYTPDFFVNARPATAMDMINRLPGFSFDGGDGSRGFSGNSGNVLIDGKRPTSKNDSLSSVLSRIVAADVDHIEVIHGSAPGIDMQGKSVMANVIRKTGESTSIVTTAGAYGFTTGRVIPQGSLQFSSTEGERSYNISIRRDANFNNQMGRSGITRIDANGVATETPEKVAGSGGNTALNGGLRLPLAGGDFSANAAANQSESSNSTFYDDPVTPQTYESHSRGQNGEIGASYEVPLGGTVLGIEALQRLGHSVSSSLLGGTGGDERYASLRDTGESIGHVTLRYPLSDTLTLEGGGEAAFNYLRGHSLYTLNGTTVSVPSSEVDVSEMREEVFATLSWRMDDDLMLDTGLRAEYSTISEQGDVSQSRSFFYPKPRFQLTWTLDPSSTLRLRAEQRLGQLNFGDFISSVNLTQNNVTAGNPDIEPDQRWQFEAVYEYHFWDRGALTIGLLHQEISNILGNMPLADSNGQLYDTRGNIGTGRSDALSVDATIPTDKVAFLKGGRLNINLDWRDSSVLDPLTHVARRFQSEDASSYNFGFVQDLEDWKSTWSVNYSHGWKQIGYRLSTIDRSFGNPQLNLNWTYKPQSDLNFNFSVANVLTARRTRVSDYFTGPRNISALQEREIEVNYARPNFYFNIRRTFH